MDNLRTIAYDKERNRQNFHGKIAWISLEEHTLVIERNTLFRKKRFCLFVNIREMFHCFCGAFSLTQNTWETAVFCLFFMFVVPGLIGGYQFLSWKKTWISLEEHTLVIDDFYF